MLLELRKRMRKAGDPARAIGQQAYMKSAMPYHGLRNAEMRALCKELFSDYDFSSFEGWSRDIRQIWRGAKFREERYAAIELAQHRKARAHHTMQSLPLFEEMIVTGAWWDYVDSIASHDLGSILTKEGKPMRRAMLAWSKCDDMWKRRSSILCQLGFKEKTDLELLYACIEPSIESKEFFLRKAIGWALRQLAWSTPEETLAYVRKNQERLSGLSIREAMKNLGGIDALGP